LSGAKSFAAQISAGKIPAAKIAEIQRTIFNLRLDAVVTAALASMILVLVAEALFRWTAILTKRSEAVLHETPYVATQWAAGAEGD
jgi:carbon starvation protein